MMMDQRRVVSRNGVKKPGVPNRVVVTPRPSRPALSRPTPAGAKPRPGAAPAPAPAGARPVPRPLPPVRRPARPATRTATPRDPLDALVDSIINSRVSPIADERREAREQAAGNIRQQEQLGAAYADRVKGLRENANLDLGAAVAQAAKLRGYSEDTLREYQDWARGLLANTHGGSGDATVAESANDVLGANRAAFDSMSAEIAARGQGLNDWLAKRESSGAALTGELVNQERQRLSAAERGFASRIAQERAQRGELKYELAQKEREFQLQKEAADRAFGLQKDQFEWGKATDLARLSSSDSDSGSSAKKGEPADKGIYGFGRDRDQMIAAAIATWRQGLEATTDKKGNVIPPAFKQPWRDLFSLLRDSSLTADQAALLATRTSPGSIRGAKNGARGVLTMLRNRGVSGKAQRFIIVNYFGLNAWNRVKDGKPAPSKKPPKKPLPVMNIEDGRVSIVYPEPTGPIIRLPRNQK